MIKNTTCLFLMLLLSFLLISCGIDSDNTIATTEHVIYESSLQSDSPSYDSYSELYEKADLIVRGVITDKKEVTLAGNSKISTADILKNIEEDPHTGSLLVMSIRTPYDFKISEAYKDANDTYKKGDTISIFIPGGNYNGYLLNTEYSQLDKGGEYILFLTYHDNSESPFYSLITPYQSYISVKDKKFIFHEYNTLADEKITPDTFQQYLTN